MKRCCIIYNEPRPGALPDELDVLDQVEHIEKHLIELGISVYRKGFSDRFMDEIQILISEKPDFVFNLVESINNCGELIYFVPALLNLHKIPYSGNSFESIFLTSSKTLASKAMKAGGVPNPGSYKPSQHKLLIPGRKYIIKPIWEDGSLGITADSVFVYKPENDEIFKGKDDAHWFIEDFIDGREFNMSVLAGKDGPEVMPPAEIVFVDYGDTRPRIVDFKAKWEEDSFEYDNTVREFPGEALGAELEKNLKEAARKSWHLFGLKGYARVDARIDSDNNVYVIEINANPCISPNGGFVAATRKGGYPFTTVLHRIIDDLNDYKS
jgi:D-alanine-D-alanine ligase